MLQVYQVLFLCPKLGKPGSFSPKKAMRVGTSLPKLAMRVLFIWYQRTIFIIYKWWWFQASTKATATSNRHRHRHRHRQASTKKQHVLLIREVCFRIDSYFTSSAAQHCILRSKQSKHTTSDYYYRSISIGRSDRYVQPHPIRTYRSRSCYITAYYPAHTL